MANSFQAALGNGNARLAWSFESVPAGKFGLNCFACTVHGWIQLPDMKCLVLNSGVKLEIFPVMPRHGRVVGSPA
jgi:hypothetical protein